ncbi:MAG: hypothetical protein ABSH20_05695 [Tepidisphaeraceae bacterium]|jgi:hypothetical protein
MAQPPSTTSGAHVFDIARALVELRYVVEIVWCDTSDTVSGVAEDGVAPGLQRIVEIARRIAWLAEEWADATKRSKVNHACRRLLKAIEKFRAHFIDDWRDARPRAVPADPEFQWHMDKCLVENSPLAGPEWASVETSWRDLQGAMPPPLQACFEMGWLLASASYPTFTGGERNRPDLDEFAYWRVELPAAVERAATKLHEHYPYLAAIDLSLPSSTERDRTLDRIDELCTQLAKLLREPPPPDSQPDGDRVVWLTPGQQAATLNLGDTSHGRKLQIAQKVRKWAEDRGIPMRIMLADCSKNSKERKKTPPTLVHADDWANIVEAYNARNAGRAVAKSDKPFRPKRTDRSDPINNASHEKQRQEKTPKDYPQGLREMCCPGCGSPEKHEFDNRAKQADDGTWSQGFWCEKCRGLKDFIEKKA